MKKRLTFALIVCLSSILIVNPLLTLANGSQRELLYNPVTAAFSNTSKKSESAKPTNVPALLKSRNSKLRQDGTPAGQSQTLLPDGKLLLLGGETADTTSSDAFIKDPRTNELIPLVNKLQRARSWHTATTLPDGKILILGGVNADGQVEKIAEIFDPEIQTSEVIEIKGMTARAHHTATLLTDGRLLIAGGLSSKGKALKSVELLNVESGLAFASRAKLKTGRSSHTALLQANGEVWLWGGINKEGAAIQNGERLAVNTNGTEEKARVVALESLPEPNNQDYPRLEFSLPQDGAAEVETDTRLALRFSKPLRVESVNAENVTLNGPYGRAEIKIVPAEKGMLAFLTPKTALLPGATYTLALANSSDANNQTMAPTSITFTTAKIESANGLSDDEEWIPDAKNLEGDWQSHRQDSPWRQLPPLQAPDGVTALAGQVLKLNGKPLANVTMQIGDKSATTDDTGRFLITDLQAGHQVMIINSQTANRPGKSYCMLNVGVEIETAKTTPLDYTIWLPAEDKQNATPLSVPTTKEIVATTPRIPGLEIHIPKGVVLRTAHGHPLTELSLTPIPLDRPPFPLPEGAQLFFTPQVHGASVEAANGEKTRGIRIHYPNFGKLAVGTRVDLLTYDAREKGWYSYGQGEVSQNGKQIVPDAGVEIYRFSCVQVLGNPNQAPAEGMAPGSGKTDGDPVDLGTGLFVLNAVDLLLPDTMPIVLSRTYRPRDTTSRQFGIGATHPYQMFLVGDTTNFTYAHLILPDGGRIKFNRISSGTSSSTAVLEHTATPTAFYKALLSYNQDAKYWELRFKDDTVYRFQAVIGSPPALTAITDRYGNKLSIVRNSGVQIGRIYSPNGRWVELTYDTASRITQAKDNLGRVVSYTYDASGRLWKVTDVGGGITEYGYDASHRMTTIKDAKGIVYLTNQYDANGRVTLQTQADATTYQFAYTLDGNGKVTQTDVTDPRGNIRRVVFNAEGYATSEKFAVGTALEQTYTYTLQSGTNFMQRVTDPLGRHSDFTYDATGNVTSVTSLAGTANAVSSSFTYNAAFNTLATVTDPLSHTTTFGYDSLGSLTSVTDALSHQSTFTYNSNGQIATAKDAYNNTASFAYSRGDLVSSTDPLGKTSSSFVDGSGRVVSATNAIGQKVKYEYDVLNRTTKVTDPLQGATNFTYDANNNLLSVTDARNNAIQYVYDAMDRVVTRKDPLLRQVTYEYNNNGALKKSTDRKGQITQMSYDALDRLTLITYHDASTTAYTYDTGNRLTQVVDSGSGTISYSYDDLDRLLSETTAQGVVSYTYDAAGRRLTTSISGQSQISYSYDNADRLTQITQGSATVSYVYDNADRVTSVTQPNGVLAEYGYDAASRLTALTYKKNGVTLGSLTYEYDAAGRRVKMGGTLAQTGLPSALTTTAYNAANHQTTFGANTLTYDLNGNLASDGSKSYTWNARNQLTAISGGGVTASFSYDAFGRRTSKTINSTTTGFLYDGSNIVQEQSGGSATANMLTGGIDQFFSRTDASGTTSPLTNALGSVVALTDSNGVIQTQYSYEPFGKSSTSGTASSNSQKYTGREDDGTGLFYYRARYYSPDTQRFISEDPIGLAGGDINLFAYVGNSPVMATDPSGLEQFTYNSDGRGVQNPQMAGRNGDFLLGGRGKGMEGAFALAGTVAILDGPQPGPADAIALLVLLAAAASSTATVSEPGKVIPFPQAPSRDRADPIDIPAPPPPPPPPPPTCEDAYGACLDWARGAKNPLEQLRRMRNCGKAYENCPGNLAKGIPQKFPHGGWVK